MEEIMRVESVGCKRVKLQVETRRLPSASVHCCDSKIIYQSLITTAGVRDSVIMSPPQKPLLNRLIKLPYSVMPLRQRVHDIDVI